MSRIKLVKVADAERRATVALAHSKALEAARLLREAHADLGGFAPLPCSALAHSSLGQAASHAAAAAEALAH